MAKDTRLEDAEKRANNIRESISEKKFDAQITRPVTISGGVAEFHSDMNSEELIDEADKALYTAKNTGRNKICISSALNGGASY